MPRATPQRVLLLATCALLLRVPHAAAAPYRYTRGHGDLGLAYDNGFDWHVHLAPGAVVNGAELTGDLEADPADVDIVVPKTTAQIRPSGSQYDFIGVAAGETYYRLPQSAINATLEGAPFVGLASEEIDPGQFVGNQITVRLTGLLAAPLGGQFSMYQSGGIRFMDTIDGSFANDAFAFPTGVHEHFNLSFSKPGLYLLEFTAEGAHTSDGFVSGSVVYRFQVPEPATDISLLVGLASVVACYRRLSR